MNQESSPGPVAMASHTCSGVAARVISSRISNSCVVMSGFLRVRFGVAGVAGLEARVNGQHDAVVAAAGRVLVVIAADQRRDRGGELLREGGAVGRAGEPHLRVQAEGRQWLAGLGGA